MVRVKIEQVEDGVHRIEQRTWMGRFYTFYFDGNSPREAFDDLSDKLKDGKISQGIAYRFNVVMWRILDREYKGNEEFRSILSINSRIQCPGLCRRLF